MKKRYISVYYSILLMFCPVFLAFFSASPVFAGVNDFYFEDFVGDYYLSGDKEGVSRLKVIESVTAVFPDFEQNKGICRQIAFTNQDGMNITLPNLSSENLKLTRNGKPEPIYNIEREDNYYSVCTGDENYVLGEQVYTFEYEFSRVVTEFQSHQELYWDANGNGAQQRFDKVTARVHVDPEILDSLTGEAWCYVGKYGESGQDRCEILKTDDGFKFSARELAAGENLTFDIEIKPGTFVVPEPEERDTLLWVFAVVVGICLVAVGFSLKSYMKARKKAQHYKGIFVKPEYQPSKEYNLAEMTEIYHGKKKDLKVAMLLDLIVRRKIQLRKDGKKNWSFKVISLNGVSAEEKILLSILNGGSEPKLDDSVEIKSRTATSALIKLAREFEMEVVKEMKQDGLVEGKYRYGEGRGESLIALILVVVFLVTPIVGILILVAEVMIFEIFGLSGFYGRIIFGEKFFWATFWVIVGTTMASLYFTTKSQEFKNYTEKGMVASRYMDGLKLYIGMAEAERMEMLQSVKGADVSPAGIVKLYEKLLPYAAVFGLEESWMNEMQQYCRVEEISEPDYLLTGLAVSEISRNLRTASMYATTATTLSSSGSVSSSSFSGGGGGGFSGGGGGGGGFSGR